MELDPQLVEDAHLEIERTLRRIEANSVMRSSNMTVGGKVAAIQVQFKWGPEGKLVFLVGSDDADRFKIISQVMISADQTIKDVFAKLQKTEIFQLFRKVQYAVMKHAIEFSPVPSRQEDSFQPYLGWQIGTVVWHIDNPQFMYDRVMKLASAQSEALALFNDEIQRFNDIFVVESQVGEA